MLPCILAVLTAPVTVEPAPSPSAGAATLACCDDTCGMRWESWETSPWANDGICDDGSQMGRVPNLCPFGTDCTDCGSRCPWEQEWTRKPEEEVLMNKIDELISEEVLVSPEPFVQNKIDELIWDQQVELQRVAHDHRASWEWTDEAERQSGLHVVHGYEDGYEWADEEGLYEWADDEGLYEREDELYGWEAELQYWDQQVESERVANEQRSFSLYAYAETINRCAVGLTRKILNWNYCILC
jgi:hypothetical protein